MMYFYENMATKEATDGSVSDNEDVPKPRSIFVHSDALKSSI